MPCRCTEDLHYILGHRYKTDSLTYPYRTNSSTKLPKVLIEAVDARKRTKQSNYIFVMGEKIYDTCAGFNLRYCRIQGFRSRNHKGLLQDLLVLCCFLLTNLVVLATILAWTALHIGSAVVAGFQWLKRQRKAIQPDVVPGTMSPIQSGGVSALIQVGETPTYTSTAA